MTWDLSTALVMVLCIAGVGYMIHRLHDHLNRITEATSTGLPIQTYGPRVKVIQLNLYAMGCFIWPIAAIVAMHQEWDTGTLITHPIMWAITAWVMILLAMDVVLVGGTPAGSMNSVQAQQKEIKSTFMSVVGSVFAFGVLLSAITEKSGRSKRAAQIGITGLLVGLAFAIPVLETNRDSIISHTVTCIMKVACLIAVAIFMSGVAIELVPG
jgi:hypothetical protein